MSAVKPFHWSLYLFFLEHVAMTFSIRALWRMAFSRMTVRYVECQGVLSTNLMPCLLSNSLLALEVRCNLRYLSIYPGKKHFPLPEINQAHDDCKCKLTLFYNCGSKTVGNTGIWSLFTPLFPFPLALFSMLRYLRKKPTNWC